MEARGLRHARERVFVNRTWHAAAPWVARTGGTYAMEFGGVVMPNDFAIPFAAFSFAHLPLPPYGTIGLDPTALVPLAFTPVVAGTGVLTVLIPNQPALAGLRFGFQAILGDGQNLHLSPVVHDVVGF